MLNRVIMIIEKIFRFLFFLKTFDEVSERLFQSILSTDISFFKFEVIKIIEKIIKYRMIIIAKIFPFLLICTNKLVKNTLFSLERNSYLTLRSFVSGERVG